MAIKKIELLSPAKNLECGTAAVNYGADAVYIGAPKYGARAAAGNSLTDIEQLIKYAHKFNSKVYVALNTILYDSELDEVQSTINTLYNTGADAVIIQDMGILEMDLPPIPLFASTQTNNYDLPKIKFLESIGLQRVILARELSLEQIKKIKDNTSIELESFVHGALCVCLSGQCYFSQATTGRSANRGECSQPCRMLYSLEDSSGKIIEKEKYLLSLKDLNLSAYLADMISAGITSFKIEGRLKDINYVKNITAYYRQKLDELIEGNSEYKKSSSGKIFFSFTPDPERTFNRGYTEHFISGKSNDLASLTTQKSTGKLLGIVKRIDRNYFEINTSEIISNGDGICFFDKNEILCGMYVNNFQNGRIYSDDLTSLYVGAGIFRNHDHLFLKELSKDETCRKILVNFYVEDNKSVLNLTAIDEDNNKIETAIKTTQEPAKEPANTVDIIKKQLGKTGNSIFTVNKIIMKLINVYFITVADLNKLRRTALELLEQERIKNYQVKIVTRKPDNSPFPLNKVDYTANITNKKAEAFYKKHSAEIIEPGLELLSEKKERVVLTSKYCIKSQLNICPFKENCITITDIKEPLILNDGKRKFKLEFDCSQCRMSIIM